MWEHRRFAIAQLFLGPSKRRSMRPTLFMDDTGLQLNKGLSERWPDNNSDSNKVVGTTDELERKYVR